MAKCLNNLLTGEKFYDTLHLSKASKIQVTLVFDSKISMLNINNKQDFAICIETGVQQCQVVQWGFHDNVRPGRGGC